MNTIVVARRHEPVDWLNRLPAEWEPLVVQKDVDVANDGREATSFLWALARLRPQLALRANVAFVQGDPFPHTADLVSQLGRPFAGGFRWLGDPEHTTERDGSPHHPGLPVERCLRSWFGREWDGTVLFAAGGQFIVTGRAIRQKPARFYRDLAVKVAAEPDGAWVMERLWGEMFGWRPPVEAH